MCASFYCLYHVTNANWKVIDNLGLSYHTPKELNNIIDNELPGRPPFQCQELIVGDDTLEFYFRDILQCIRTIYGDPEFTRDLVFAPERHYTDHERTCRVYSEMHTGDWWWAVQVRSHLLDRFKCLQRCDRRPLKHVDRVPLSSRSYSPLTRLSLLSFGESPLIQFISQLAMFRRISVVSHHAALKC
jgi:hypothetical protein